MRTTNSSRMTLGILRCTSRRSEGCGLPVSVSITEPQPWRMVPTSSGSGLGITVNTTDLLAVSNRNETPNGALQRTAPRVTLAAACHPAACAHPAPAAFPQPARRAPQSLSLGSLGAATRIP